MEKNKQERVVELYNEKSEIFKDLSRVKINNVFICDDKYEHFYARLASVSDSFLAEIKKVTETHLQQRLQEIDKELNEL